MLPCQVICFTLTIFFWIQTVVNADHSGKTKKQDRFEVAYSWEYLNFTWSCSSVYQEAVISKRYIPSKNTFSGIKYYSGRLYLSLPRTALGTPVTVASIPVASSNLRPLLEPYPSWEMNVQQSCSTLQNVYAIEIDSNGVMWVIDGFRVDPTLTGCPPKIVLLDMKKNGTVLQTFVLPKELCDHQGGWLNDLVVDESDGGYAYISESSNLDPGIIVYSRKQNAAWKLRDCSTFAEPNAAGFSVKGITVNGLLNINGIALSQKSSRDRLFYFSALTGYGLYALSTKILKNSNLTLSSNWRKHVEYVGRRPSIGDGMVIDNKGHLYLGAILDYGVARWNTNKKPFDKHVEMIYENYTTVDWPDCFGFDDQGNLYLTADESERVLNTSKLAPPACGIRFRILKHYTGTNSYLYS